VTQTQTTQPTIFFRERECMSCGHTWRAQVVLSKYTTNLSGEAKLWCPECSSDGIKSSPAMAAGDTWDK